MNWRILLAGLVVTLLGLKIYSDRTVRQAKSTTPPAGRFVQVEGLHLHYLAKGSGQPVLLLHASGLVLQDFTLSIFDPITTTYHAIAFDRPGYGYSQRPADELLSLALNARLIHRALNRLGLERPILVGHSSGGSVALRYALDYPDETGGLVLLAPTAYAQGVSRPAMFALPDIPVLGSLFLHLLVTPLWQVLTRWFGAGLFTPNSPPAGYRKTMAPFTIRPDQFRTWADELKRLPADLREQSPHYPDIGVPVVIIAGEADQIHFGSGPADQAYPLQRAIPHAQLVMLKETGHMVHHQQPEAVLAAIRWVQQHEIVESNEGVNPMSRGKPGFGHGPTGRASGENDDQN